MDVIDIKTAVKNNEIRFYLLKDGIYCENKNSKEVVKVATCKLDEMVKFHNNGVTLGFSL